MMPVTTKNSLHATNGFHFINSTKQILKGTAALCGLSALGGLAYWVSGWLRGADSSNNMTEEKALANPLQGRGLELRAEMNALNPINQAKSELDERGFNLRLTDIQRNSQQVEEGVFSGDTLKYREKTSSDYSGTTDDELIIPSSVHPPFDAEAPIVLVNNQLTIYQYGSVIINSDMLKAVEDGYDSNALIFFISQMQHGQFEWISNPTVAIDRFNQSEVSAGHVKFIHDGTQLPPSYQTAVADNMTTTEPQDAVITFDTYPVITKNSLRVYQGQTVPITPTELSASTTYQDPTALNFTILNLQHGRFTLSDSPALNLTTFFQAQITNHQIHFVHDNTAYAPSYQVTVGDGILETAPIAATITFIANPTLTNNKLTVAQGQKIIMSSNMLSATDGGLESDNLIFEASDVTHGQFTFISNPDIAILSFSQATVTANSVQFTHDGSSESPTYAISVYNGVMRTTPIPAIVTFVPSQPDSHVIRDAIIGASVSGSIGIGLWLFKRYVDYRARSEFGGYELQNRICQAILKRVKISGCLGYMNNVTAQDLRNAATALLKALAEIHVEVDVEKMDRAKQQNLINEVGRQTRNVLLARKTCLSKVVRFFKDFCVAEVTPEDIEQNAQRIARVVKFAIASQEIMDSKIEQGQYREINEKGNEQPVYSMSALAERSAATLKQPLLGSQLCVSSSEVNGSSMYALQSELGKLNQKTQSAIDRISKNLDSLSEQVQLMSHVVSQKTIT